LIRITKTELLKNKFTSLRQFITGNTVFVFVFIIAGLFSVKVISRNPDWKNNVTLYGSDVKACDKSARTHFNWALEILNTLSPNEKDKEKQNHLQDLAIEELNKSISIYPIDYRIRMLLGNAYYNKEDVPNSTKNYELALKLLPAPDPKVFYNLSTLYERTGQLDQSLAYADSAIKYAPDTSFTYNQKGVVLSKLKRFEEAIQSFQKCVDLNPSFVLALKNIGICYMNLQQGQKALEYFTKAQSMEPADPRYAGLIEAARQTMGGSSKGK
jgi:tetratricopeptide (TPR) repeat protein